MTILRKTSSGDEEGFRERKDITFYLKLFPLVKIHPKAYEKSMTIVCKKSLELLEDNFAGKKLPPPECKTKEIDENLILGKSLESRGRLQLYSLMEVSSLE